MDDGGGHAMEESLDLAAIVNGLANGGDEFFGHVETAALSMVGEGKNPGGMLVAACARGTAGADTGFVDLGQGTFEGWPEALELLGVSQFRIDGQEELLIHV